MASKPPVSAPLMSGLTENNTQGEANDSAKDMNNKCDDNSINDIDTVEMLDSSEGIYNALGSTNDGMKAGLNRAPSSIKGLLMSEYNNNKPTKTPTPSKASLHRKYLESATKAQSASEKQVMEDMQQVEQEQSADIHFNLVRNHEYSLAHELHEDGSAEEKVDIVSMISEDLEETSDIYVVHLYLHLANICRHIWKHPWFSSYMFLCIGAAGIVVGMQTYEQFETNSVLYVLDFIILASFGLEIVLKMIGEGLRPWNYFCNSEWKWNVFDFLIVVFSLPILPGGGGGQLKLLRLVRLMRLSKVFKRIPQLNMIMRGLIDSMNFVSYIVLLWFLVIYLYGITGILLFAENDPWHFQSLEFAFITLFQVTVMDVSFDECLKLSPYIDCI